MKLRLAAACLLLAGCGGTLPYQKTAPDNVLLASSIQSRMKGTLHVHAVDGCGTRYLGSVDLDRPSVAVGLPADRESYLVFSFDSASLFGAKTSTSVGTLFRPRSGQRYEFAVTYRDSIYRVTMREAGSTRELPKRDLPRC